MQWSPQRGPQTAFHECPAFELLFGGAAGGSKVLELDGKILTPFGWKLGRDLRVGDRVNAPDGTTSRVIQIHPLIRFTGVRVSFHDGTSTVVGWDHLWLVWRSGKRRKQPNGASVFGEPGAEVIETRELAKWLESASASDGRSCWPLIPICAPQVFNIQRRYKVELDSYQLGYWLGDGNKSGPNIRFTTKDHEHFREQFTMQDVSYNGNFEYRLKGPRRKHWEKQLKRAGLDGTKADTKFIPDEFLWGSIRDRQSMLQGLMDTDGTVDQRGQLHFTSVSKKLADGVVHLVQSLGGTATMSEQEPFYRDKLGNKVFCKTAYTLYIKLPDEQGAFRLKRKRERCTGRGNLYRRVVKVEEVDQRYGHCITVSHPSGLYLTNDFIVTHNSESLLVESSRHVAYPDYRAVLFRRTFPELEASLVPRAYDLFSGAATPKNKGLKWVFQSGAVIEMAHLQREEDKEKHKSSQYDYVGFDELTSFMETQYNYLFSRCRGKNPKIERKMRAGSNPTGIGYAWVKDRFITVDSDLVSPIAEIPFEFACGWKYRGRTYTSFNDLPEGFNGTGDPVFSNETYTIYKEKKSGLTRAFIPALLWGNKKLLENDPEYIKRLRGLDEYQTEALLTGSWDFPEGQFFDWNPRRHIAEPFEIPDFWDRYVSIDYGYTAPMAAIWFAVSPEGDIFAYRELYARRLTTEDQAKFIIDMTGDEKVNWYTADPSMFSRQGTGESHADVYGRHGVYLSPSSNKRIPGWAIIHEYLSNGKFHILPSCPNLIREFPSAQHAKRNPEDLDTTGNDHALDACRYFFLTLKGQSSQQETTSNENLPSWWKKIQKDKQRRKKLLESAL